MKRNENNASDTGLSWPEKKFPTGTDQRKKKKKKNRRKRWKERAKVLGTFRASVSAGLLGVWWVSAEEMKLQTYCLRDEEGEKK